MSKIRNKNGSALVFSLLVLFVMLAAALGVASVTAISRRMSGTTGKSVSSFQVADSGVEMVLQKIYQDTTLTDISSLAKSMCNNTDCCNGGVISSSISPGKNFSLIFFDNANSDPLNCNANISDISFVKSTGTYANTSRAVEVAVASGRLNWVTPTTLENGWTNTGGALFNFGYAIDTRSNLVYLRGTVGGGDLSGTGSCVFKLPEVYRPQSEPVFVTAGGSPNGIVISVFRKNNATDPGCVKIHPNGGASNNWVSLDGIVFSID